MINRLRENCSFSVSYYTCQDLSGPIVSLCKYIFPFLVFRAGCGACIKSCSLLIFLL